MSGFADLLSHMKHIAAPLALVLLTPAVHAETVAGTRWVTLGTSGGPEVQIARSQIANALVVGDSIYLFDLGNGVRRQMAMAGLQERQVKAVFLSHHHSDHNADLGSVLVNHWRISKSVLPVIGPEGTTIFVEGLAAANAPTVLASFPTSGPARPSLAETVRATDLPAPIDRPRLIYEDANIRVEAINVPHYQDPPSVALPKMPQAVAFKVMAGGRSYVYSGDTGPGDNLAILAKDADVLVTEVVEPAAIAAQLAKGMKDAPAPVREAIIRGMSKNHLTPAEIGRIAAKANVKEVVLTHFVPSPENASDPQAYVRDICAVFKGKVTMARDLDAF